MTLDGSRVVTSPCRPTLSYGCSEPQTGWNRRVGWGYTELLHFIHRALRRLSSSLGSPLVLL
jgi:hypothetical protein